METKSDETKIIYYTSDDDKMPYLIKLNLGPEKATLRDFKFSLNTINPNQYKFFFQTIVDDFGVVKEELKDDEAKLPSVNGRVVCWLVQVDGSVAESTTSNHGINEKFNIDGGGGCGAKKPILSHNVNNSENIYDLMSKNNAHRRSSKQGSQNQQPIYESVAAARKNSISNTNKQNFRNIATTPLK